MEASLDYGHMHGSPLLRKDFEYIHHTQNPRLRTLENQTNKQRKLIAKTVTLQLCLLALSSKLNEPNSEGEKPHIF